LVLAVLTWLWRRFAGSELAFPDGRRARVGFPGRGRAYWGGHELVLLGTLCASADGSTRLAAVLWSICDSRSRGRCLSRALSTMKGRTPSGFARSTCDSSRSNAVGDEGDVGTVRAAAARHHRSARAPGDSSDGLGSGSSLRPRARLLDAKLMPWPATRRRASTPGSEEAAVAAGLNGLGDEMAHDDHFTATGPAFTGSGQAYSTMQTGLGIPGGAIDLSTTSSQRW
jgi:hypothetical protein